MFIGGTFSCVFQWFCEGHLFLASCYNLRVFSVFGVFMSAVISQDVLSYVVRDISEVEEVSSVNQDFVIEVLERWNALMHSSHNSLRDLPYRVAGVYKNLSGSPVFYLDSSLQHNFNIFGWIQDVTGGKVVLQGAFALEKAKRYPASAFVYRQSPSISNASRPQNTTTTAGTTRVSAPSQVDATPSQTSNGEHTGVSRTSFGDDVDADSLFDTSGFDLSARRDAPVIDNESNKSEEDLDTADPFSGSSVDFSAFNSAAPDDVDFPVNDSSEVSEFDEVDAALLQVSAEDSASDEDDRTIAVSVPGSAPERDFFRLRVLSGGYRGHEFEMSAFSSRSYVVGRADESVDFCPAPVKTISRNHAEFKVVEVDGENVLRVRDMGSVNHTFVSRDKGSHFEQIGSDFVDVKVGDYVRFHDVVVEVL